MVLRCLFLAVTVAACAHATLPDRINSYQFLQHGMTLETPYPRLQHEIKEGWITQKLNHFDPVDNRTWEQRYFYYDDVYQPGGPVFLFVFGEAAADPAWISENFISDMAIENGAFVIVLEHRFYGESKPLPDLSTPNLKYFTIDQTLEDTVVFTQAMMMDPRLNLTGPWILIGASYSADLVVWIRARYPQFYYGVYAAAAPLLATYDFTGYHEVVNKGLQAASPECPTVVKAAIDELAVMIEAGEAEKISTMLNFCETVNLSNPDDVLNIYSFITKYFGSTVQNSFDGKKEARCATLIAGRDKPLETLGELIKTSVAPRCLWAVHQDVLDYYRDHVEYNNLDIFRPWFFQTCTELGFWQTLSSPELPFGQLLPVEFLADFCPNVFGPEYTSEVNLAGVERSNLIYGGLNPEVRRVVFTSGTLDPWGSIGIKEQLTPDSPLIFIEGESHCRDVYPPADYDSQAVKDARLQVAQIIKSWVQQAYRERH